MRKQIRLLAEFLRGFNFIHMKPARDVVGSATAKQQGVQVLAEAGKQYAIYLRQGKNASLEPDLPRGKYEGEWLDPVSGLRLPVPSFEHSGGRVVLKSPEFSQDGALRLVSK